MFSFRRLWVGPIPDYPSASRIVIAAGISLPAMYAASLAGLWIAGSKIGYQPAPLNGVTALTLAAFVVVGAWLVWRTSRTASLLIAVLSVTAAAVTDYLFATWIIVRTISDISCCGVAAIDARFWIFAGTIFFLAAGWSAAAFLSWRAVLATFAAPKLRRLLTEAFD